ncbi:MAG: hypothetical protein ABJZ55_04955 [Fuerstiella sp.]
MAHRLHAESTLVSSSLLSTSLLNPASVNSSPGNLPLANPQAGPTTLTIKRGLTAQLQFSHPEASLQAAPDQSMDAEVLVRLERTGQAEGTFQYTLWFFGTVAGNYDLAKLIVTGDGLPLTDSHALPPMMAQIVSDLPPDRGTNLYEIKDPSLRAPGGYRAILIAFAVLWTAVPIVLGYLRWKATRPEPEPEVIPEPTLSDRLRPLVQQASEGRLSVEEQSRLELLIYVFWQRRLSLPDSMVDALPVMRRHDEAGGLLRSLEAWIHDEATSSQSLDSAKMEELLAPYQSSDVSESSDAEVGSQPSVVGGTA